MAIRDLLITAGVLLALPVFVWLFLQYLNWGWRLITRWNRKYYIRQELRLQGELSRLLWEREQSASSFERGLYDEKIEKAEENLTEFYHAHR